jgi:16S rRNA (cytidine1402-2'-O)-methyltransferase
MVLREADLVAAEDTRRTRKLLTHFGIRAKLLSYREQNREKAGADILAHLRTGKSAVIVTDAGTPGLSDPGHHLVRLCVANNITVVPVPGANALTAALSVSGMPLDKFLFEGFLPSRSAARKDRLAEIGATGLPFVLYESPRRIAGTLQDAAVILGDREVFVAREMTKMHEEFIRGSVSEVAEFMKNQEVLGEVTVVVSGGDTLRTNLNILGGAKRLLKAGLPPSKTAGVLSELTGVDRNSLYRIIAGLPGKKPRGGKNG